MRPPGEVLWNLLKEVFKRLCRDSLEGFGGGFEAVTRNPPCEALRKCWEDARRLRGGPLGGFEEVTRRPSWRAVEEVLWRL